MNNSQKIKKMVGLSLLASLVVVLQLVSPYIPLGPVTITLALIPIAVGAVIYGPTGGFILGCVLGVLVCVDPTTTVFLQYSFIGTVIVCMLKSSLAGMLAGIAFKLIKKINIVVAIVIASILVPIINTGLFALAGMTIFMPLIEGWAGGNGPQAISFLFLTMIGSNFIFEFIINSALSPVVVRIYNIWFPILGTEKQSKN